MSAVEWLGGAVCGDILLFTMPPDIPARLDVDIEVGASEDDDLVHGLVPLERVIDILFERNNLATAITAVRSNNDLGAAVGNAILDALGAESTEYDGVDGTDPGAGKHRNRRLWDERHVDQDAVSFFDTVPLEDIGELTDLTMELSVSQDALFSWLPLPDDRCLVAARRIEMAVEAVIGGVELPSHEPLGIGDLPIQNLGPFLEPVEFPGLPGPEGVGLADRLGMELLVLGKAADSGLFGKFGRGFENAVFDEMGFDVLGHGSEEGKLVVGGWLFSTEFSFWRKLLPTPPEVFSLRESEYRW